MKPPRKIGGPPKKQPKPGERVALSIRLTPDLKRKLDEAAERGGRSQSQEAEFRLELSFHREELLIESMKLLFGSQVSGLLYMLGTVMISVGSVTQNRYSSDRKSWLSQPYPYDQAVHAVMRLLEALRPEGDPSPPADGSSGGPWGEQLANMMIQALLGRPVDGEIFKPDAEEIRRLLGPVAQQIREP